MTFNSIRAQVFEVIVRQAMAGAPWREICARPMEVNRITPEEVEQEVERRLFGYRKVLSEAEATNLESYLAHWQKVSAGGKVSHSSQDDLIQLLEELYGCLGLALPPVIVCESPVKLFFFLSCLQFLEAYADKGINSFNSSDLLAYGKKLLANFDQSESYNQSLLNWLKTLPESLLAGPGSPITIDVKDHFRKKYLKSIKDTVQNEVEDDLAVYLKSGVPAFLGSSFTRQAMIMQLVLNDISTDVIDLIEEHRVESSNIPQFFQGNRMRDITVSIRGSFSQTNEIFPDDIKTIRAANSFYFINGHVLALWAETEMLAYNMVANHLSYKKNFSSSEQQALRLVSKLLEYSPWYSFFENCCIVSDYSYSMKLDEQMRVHGTEEPAISFADGFQSFALSGVVIPRAIARDPDSVNVNSIDNIRNVEVRRLLIERYGPDNYLMESGAELIHEDEFGELFRKDYDDDESLVMVRVTNSTMEPDGTHKKYFLRVPPTITTARDAVAWTFGMEDGQEYKPEMES